MAEATIEPAQPLQTAGLRPGATATEAEIIGHCRSHLAAYKLPRSVRFVPDLPRTSTGKVMRRELKKLDG